jgi:hypothetical protein
MVTSLKQTIENVEHDIFIFAHQTALREAHRISVISNATADSSPIERNTLKRQEEMKEHRSTDSNLSNASTKKEGTWRQNAHIYIYVLAC